MVKRQYNFINIHENIHAGQLKMAVTCLWLEKGGCAKYNNEKQRCCKIKRFGQQENHFTHHPVPYHFHFTSIIIHEVTCQVP